MLAREFVYWLQGYFEISGSTALTPQQVDLIKRHLNLVFIHEIDPSYPDNQQQALNQAHSGQGWGAEVKPSNPLDDSNNPIARC